MRLCDPHCHMYCRLTDDYEHMAVAGITTIVEPAFWLGTERTHPESFYDYFEHITVFERKRAERYGVRHYQCIGVNPKDAENLEVTLPTIKGMRRFFERPSVVGVGEIGLNNNTENEMVGLEAQLDLAQELGLPALVHTPHVDKKKGVEMIRGLLEKRRDWKRELIEIDHITEETIDIVRDLGVWVAMTVYPYSKLSPERAVAMVAKHGLERMLVNSSVDWGESDPLSVPKVVRLMRREGWKERDIEELVWRNPIRFWRQSGRVVETEVVE
jgi:uncharacterized protein